MYILIESIKLSFIMKLMSFFEVITYIPIITTGLMQHVHKK